MTVNELARAAGMPPGKVRYYARRGLLPAARRDPGNGYRCFDTAALARLRFIAAARALGFPLRDITHLLASADAGASPCPQVRALVDARLAELAAQRRALAREQARLAAVRAQWLRMPDGTPDAHRLCPLLDSVAHGVRGGRLAHPAPRAGA